MYKYGLASAKDAMFKLVFLRLERPRGIEREREREEGERFGPLNLDNE